MHNTLIPRYLFVFFSQKAESIYQLFTINSQHKIRFITIIVLVNYKENRTKKQAI